MIAKLLRCCDQMRIEYVNVVIIYAFCDLQCRLLPWNGPDKI